MIIMAYFVTAYLAVMAVTFVADKVLRQQFNINILPDGYFK